MGLRDEGAAAAVDAGGGFDEGDGGVVGGGCGVVAGGVVGGGG